MAQDESRRLKVLDGLRGIAILLVVFFHLWQISWLSSQIHIFGISLNFDVLAVNGYLGVDLFFFLSGFCLLFSYAHLSNRRVYNQSLAEFAFRRAIKILPSYALAVCLILIFIPPVFRSAGEMIRHTAAHLFFVHNWFSDTYGSINGVLWSIAVEVQFYCLFPFICWCFQRRPFWTFFSISLGSIAYRYIVFVYMDDRFGFLVHQLPGYLDLFLAGMLAAHIVRWISKREQKDSRTWKSTVTIGAFVSVIASVLLFYSLYRIRYQLLEVDRWTVYHRASLALCFIGICVGSAYAYQFWKMLFENRILKFFSEISYNLYLWHQTIGTRLVAIGFPKSRTTDPHQDIHWQILFCVVSVVLSIAFASVITYLIERPILRWGHRQVKAFQGFRSLLAPKSL